MTAYDEQRLAVDLDLGQLVRVQRILDGELVQPELGLQRAQVLLGRLVEADPDELVAATRVCKELDGGVLPVQGPPGSGKT